MKKYVKPELIFESFELSQQIAACDYDSNNTANDENCSFTGYNEDFKTEMTIFVTTDRCGIIAESFCYHNSTSGGFGIFNS